jgi:methionyl-tRNA formyltransferase
VLLVGQGPTTASALESLAEQLDVLAVVRPVPAAVTAEDPVIARARELGIAVEPDASVAALADLVERLAPDAVVVSSYDRVLPAALLARSRFVNVHYAPLPRYRGRANVNWALINDEPECAISIHAMAPGLDAGNLLHQERVPIGDRDTIGALYARLNDAQRRVLGGVVAAHLAGDSGTPQDEAAATYGCTRVAEDGLIDWGASTRSIDCLIRALDAPYPGAFTYLGLQRMTVWRAEPVAGPPVYAGRIPGRVVARNAPVGTVDVLTGDGVLRLREVQLEQERVPAADIVRSVRATLGVSLPALVAETQRLQTDLAAARARIDELVRQTSPTHGAAHN